MQMWCLFYHVELFPYIMILMCVWRQRRLPFERWLTQLSRSPSHECFRHCATLWFIAEFTVEAWVFACAFVCVRVCVCVSVSVCVCVCVRVRVFCGHAVGRLSAWVRTCVNFRFRVSSTIGTQLQITSVSKINDCVLQRPTYLPRKKSTSGWP